MLLKSTFVTLLKSKVNNKTNQSIVKKIKIAKKKLFTFFIFLLKKIKLSA